MGIDREILRQIGHLLRPLATRIANTVSRGVVHLVNDAKKLQLVQLDDVEDGEHHQPYGFSSIPLAGAEAVTVFPNGEHGHPLVVVISDRRHRPTGGQPGEVTMYSHTGAKVRMLANGDIEVYAAAGRDVLVSDGTGGLEPVVKRSEFHGHTHVTAGTGPPVPPTTIVPTAPQQTALDASFPGTDILKTK